MPAAEYAAQSGMDHTGVDLAGAAFLAELVYLVVCAGIGIVDPEYSFLDETHGLGRGLRQPKGSSEREQKPLFRQGKEGAS